MRLSEVVATHRLVSESPGRGRKAELLAELLARASPEELPVLVGLLSGRPRQGRVGVGPALLHSARARDRRGDAGASVRALDRRGDAAAPDARGPDVRGPDVRGPDVRGPGGAPLDVLGVDQALDEIAAIVGAGARARREARLRTLLRRASPAERDFLGRLVLGELRQGAGEGVLLEAVARATGAARSDLHGDVLRLGGAAAAAERHLAPRVEGEAESARIRLFRPLAPMLAATAEDPSSALTAIPAPLLEAKADGARVQVHRRSGEVRVYTRRSNEITAAVPEVVAAAGALPGGDLVLDGEAIAWGPSGPLPFQVTMRRIGAQEAGAAMLEELPLRVFWFDCLYADGDLLDRPLRERRAILTDLVPERSLLPFRSLESSGAAEEGGSAAEAGHGEVAPAAARLAIEAFLDEMHEAGFEGVMVKDPASPYRAGRRGSGWLKLKPVRTLDLVVLAAEWGSGRRRGWLSNLHLGARGSESGTFVMLGKTFKGMTDHVLAWQTEALLALETHRDPGTVWVRPEKVVEIAFEGVQRSPRYPGGVSLRFARLRRYRDDKSAEEADSIDAVRAMLPDAGPDAAPGAVGRRRRAGGGAAQRDLFDDSE